MSLSFTIRNPWMLQPQWKSPASILPPARGRKLCLADYLPIQLGIMDVAGFQVVTVGQEATDRFDRLQAAGDYSTAYFITDWLCKPPKPLPSFSTSTSAGNWHGTGQGKRYSWGYPAIPELMDHARFPVAASRKGIGNEPHLCLSACAGTVHLWRLSFTTPAKYFNIGESRVDQLRKNNTPSTIRRFAASNPGNSINHILRWASVEFSMAPWGSLNQRGSALNNPSIC